MLYIKRIRLRNIRCFEEVDIAIGPGGKLSTTTPVPLTVIVGDNATGKTALLRSIAIGLCDEAGAASLLQDTDIGFIRRGCDKAKITIDLTGPGLGMHSVCLRTTLSRTRLRHASFELVRQSTVPTKDLFPWDQIFLAAYGPVRGIVGTTDHVGYSAVRASRSLFDYGAGLQNPELVLRRMAKPTVFLDDLAQLTHTSRVTLDSAGLTVDGSWGTKMPLRDLADGYRGALSWLTDLLGWVLAKNPTTAQLSDISGIVLVDQLEEHMHAVWQRTIIDDLQRIFPLMQFIVTTHSPLIASSAGRVSEANVNKLYVLEAQQENHVLALPHELMTGWRIDQVLASRAFKYQVESDPQARAALRVGSALAVKRRSPAEERTYQSIKNLLHKSLLSSLSPIARETELEIRDELRADIQRLEKKLFGPTA